MTNDTPETKTVQVGNKLIILNGRDPLMYVDLTKKKLKRYKPPFVTRVINRLFKTTYPFTIKNGHSRRPD